MLVLKLLLQGFQGEGPQHQCSLSPGESDQQRLSRSQFESTAAPDAGVGGGPYPPGANGLSLSRVHLYPFHSSPASVWSIPYLVSLTGRQSPPPTLEARPYFPSLLAAAVQACDLVQSIRHSPRNSES